jgi:signal transduction histidine kinase
LVIKLPLKYKPDLKIILVAVLYYLFAKLGHFLAFSYTALSPAWPPSGMAFAMMLLLGRSCWPGITIGALVANITGFWSDPAFSSRVIFIVSTCMATGYTLETLAGNLLVRMWIKDRYPFTYVPDTFRFLFVTLIMSLVGVAIGSVTLNLCGVLATAALFKTAFLWWVGNVVGILLFTPFILAVARKHNYAIQPEKLIEIGVFLVCTLVVFFLVRMEYLNATLIRALPFLLIPFLLWLAFRFELLAAISGVLVASLVSIYFTIHDDGPFVLADPYNSMVLLQIFISVISISTIVLSATVTERLQAQRELKKFNETLEERVQERTKALNEEIRIRKAAEEKLQRTNQELSKRNTELDNFVYSVSHDLRAPIASVLGLINLAKKDRDTKMKDTYLEKISHSALQQDDFIREILDQSRNSRLDVKREEILFEELIDETFNQLRFATSTGKSVEKIITVKQQQPFYSDRWRLKVILNNIISNSIRYRNGKDPVIKVDVEINGRYARLAVEDNGKGIAREHLDKVYRMFYRATDDGAGSGLGLYIVKEAIDKLNGKINIDSEPGRGTTVRFEIPEIQ